MAQSTNWSGTNHSSSQPAPAPAPTVASSSQNQQRSSEGCNISGTNDKHDEPFHEPYVEAEGEKIYLSDGDDVVAPLDGSNESIVEVETNLELEPTVLPDNEYVVSYDPDNPRIELNALFPDVDAFRKALRHFAIKTYFEYKTTKSDKTRFMAKCAYPGCLWRIRASRLRDDNRTFKITVLPHEHNCPSVGRAKGTMISKSWVSERAADFLRRNPSAGAKAVQEQLIHQYRVTLNYGKAWAGRSAALVGLYGSWESSFKLVYNFKAELENKCPGSIVEIECEKVGNKMRFSKMFVALKPCIDGFIKGCRPYLAMDSTHLTGRYTGQLATACGVDGFNWLYPVAYGVFDKEKTETWTWFMTQLRKAIGNVQNLVISSDACKGLEKARTTVFPDSEHRTCLNHLSDNFKKKFHGTTFDLNLKPAGYAHTLEECDSHLSKIKKESAAAFNYLEKEGGLWCRCKFSESSKVDYVTNNISESFNNWIKDLKDLHVVEMLNQIRRRLMVTFDRRRKVGRKLTGKIVPSVMKELNAKSRHPDVRRMNVVSGDDTCAEVSGTSNEGIHWTHVVHTDKQQCSCKEWQISGKPCIHAIAFISTLRRTNLEDYVHEYYSIERYRMAYEGTIMPLCDTSRWLKYDPGFIVWPPIMTRPAGRPRKERIPNCLELGTRKQKCKRCQRFGHQARTCKEPVDGLDNVRNRNRKRKRRTKTKPATQPTRAELNAGIEC